MPAKEIKELRQAGKLDEAMQMAKAEHEASPDNVWTKRNLSWVIYEYLKANASSETFNKFLQYLKDLRDLRNSGGQGLYSYYLKSFFDSHHKEIKGNIININGVICSIQEVEDWGEYLQNKLSVVIKTEITDRLGIKLQKNFNNGDHPTRFKSLFEYLKILDRVDTHKACAVVEEKNKEISKLLARIPTNK